MSATVGTIVNTEQSTAWNGPEGTHWADHVDRTDSTNREVNAELFGAARVDHRDRVLDVGCGAGDTTRLAALRAPRGHVVGVDLSVPMLERARAAAAGLPNVTFEHGDAQVHAFPAGRFDVAISRFGIMFFTDPVAAFANIGRALRPGGRLAFVCPRDMRHCDWYLVPIGALLGIEPDPDAVRTAYPGPTPAIFSLADPAHIGDVLARAGFTSVTARPVEIDQHLGRDAREAARSLVGMGPGRYIVEQDDRLGHDVALDRLTAALRPFERPDGVYLDGGLWLVTAARPTGAPQRSGRS